MDAKLENYANQQVMDGDIPVLNSDNQELYWTVNYSRIQLKGNKVAANGSATFISFKKVGSNTFAPIDFYLTDFKLNTNVSSKHDDYQKPFCGLSVPNPPELMVHLLKSLQFAAFEYFSANKEAIYGVQEGKLKDCFYNGEGYVALNGIKFPEKSNKVNGKTIKLKCTCTKETSTLWGALGDEPCNIPFNQVYSDANKNVVDIKSQDLLEEELKLRTEAKDSDEHVKVIELVKEMNKREYCIGNIGTYIKKNSMIRKLHFKVSSVWYQKTNTTLALHFAVIKLRYGEPVITELNLDADFL